jgi:4-hydroxy-3-methylbut-2-en-1-yl diphosphate reductase
MKKFEIPAHYKSNITGRIKEARKLIDPRKKDFTPTLLDFGLVRFLLARHFGFCYGVENAVEISYKAVEENPGKRIFLLSQMIHNPQVNADLLSKGIHFIMDTEGHHFIEWDELKADDVVIIPAFGTTLEVEKILIDKDIEIQKYNTTCPFVEKVWNRSQKLGEEKYSIIIHGKYNHEETRATFSHSKRDAPSLIIKDMADAINLCKYIKGEKSIAEFALDYKGKFSEGFDPEKDLKRVGVVNQTTMLATETQAIADFIKKIMVELYGQANLKDHFADTRDTLCYATNDNQQSTYGLLKEKADFAIVVGGYNSSNTSHLVELCKEKMPTYFISSEKEIESSQLIHHYNYENKLRLASENYIPQKEVVTIVLTSGASCPDAMLDRVMEKILSYFPTAKSIHEVVENTILHQK